MGQRVYDLIYSLGNLKKKRKFVTLFFSPGNVLQKLVQEKYRKHNFFARKYLQHTPGTCDKHKAFEQYIYKIYTLQYKKKLFVF